MNVSVTLIYLIQLHSLNYIIELQKGFYTLASLYIIPLVLAIVLAVGVFKVNFFIKKN